MSLTAWALTTGEAGMRTQARGLASAVADVVVEKTLPSRAVWSLPRSLAADGLAAPWPDILVSCGRRSAASALAIKKVSGGAVFCVHVQDPRFNANRFDLVVAMDHDSIPTGPSVIKVATALHDLTPSALAEAALAWADRFAPLGRPLTGVILGGDLRGRAFTSGDTRRLLSGLDSRRASGHALAITPSRRTPQATLDLLRGAFAGDQRVFLWDRVGDNPYRGILALADTLIVTSDSVSMVSEALATPHPVEVFDLNFARHMGFIGGLMRKGLIRRFEGDPNPAGAGGPVNATEQAATAVLARLQAPDRALTGVAG